MDGSQFVGSMDSLSRTIINAIKERLGDAAGGFVVSEALDEPTPWLTLHFTAYDYLPMTYSYDRGVSGFSIDAGSRQIGISTPQGSVGLRSVEDLTAMIDELIEDARLRIPDKFLAARGW